LFNTNQKRSLSRLKPKVYLWANETTEFVGRQAFVGKPTRQDRIKKKEPAGICDLPPACGLSRLTRKPNSVSNSILLESNRRRSFLWARRHRRGSSSLPADSPPVFNAGATSRAGHFRIFGLAAGGVCRAVEVTLDAVRSYRTFSPLPAEAGGLFSVALSVGLLRLDVIKHRARGSSDFPHSD
jgi:hypothetical protein